MIHHLKRQLETLKYNTWTTKKFKIKDFFWNKKEFQLFENELPVINVKTSYGLRSFAGNNKSILPIKKLPYWGITKEVTRILWTN